MIGATNRLRTLNGIFYDALRITLLVLAAAYFTSGMYSQPAASTPSTLLFEACR